MLQAALLWENKPSVVAPDAITPRRRTASRVPIAQLDGATAF